MPRVRRRLPPPRAALGFRVQGLGFSVEELRCVFGAAYHHLVPRPAPI